MNLKLSNLNLVPPDKVKNIVFVRIPKTATSSVMFGLGRNPTDGKKTSEVWEGNKHFPSRSHLPINVTYYEKLLHRHIDYDVWKLCVDDKSISFAIVRNPFDILSSMYFSRLSSNRISNFHSFVERWCHDKAARISWGSDKRPSNKYFTYFHNCQRQYSLFHQMFSSNGECKVDVIIRYERLAEGFSLLFNDYLGYNMEISHLNRTQFKADYTFKKYYTKGLQDRVSEFHSSDLKLFGYNFDGPVDDEIFIDPKKITIPAFRYPTSHMCPNLLAHGPTNISERWPIEAWNRHKTGNVSGLIRASMAGCDLCKIMINKELDPKKDLTDYNIVDDNGFQKINTLEYKDKFYDPATNSVHMKLLEASIHPNKRLKQYNHKTPKARLINGRKIRTLD